MVFQVRLILTAVLCLRKCTQFLSWVMCTSAHNITNSLSICLCLPVSVCLSLSCLSVCLCLSLSVSLCVVRVHICIVFYLCCSILYYGFPEP